MIADATGAELLRDIIANPGDDGLRLICADWLEEYGGQPERAEFIRAQVESSRPGFCLYSRRDTCHDRRDGEDDVIKTGCVKCSAAVVRMRELLSTMVPWRADNGNAAATMARYHWAGSPLRRQGNAWTFARGFVSEVHLPLAAFMEHAGALFAAHPITAVTLTDREPQIIDSGPAGWWWDRRGLHAPDDLPHELWDALDGHDDGSGDEGFKWFDSPELAHPGLSRACVAHGRGLAKLPPLATT